MSSTEWWAKQKPEFKFLTTDKFGMCAIHTTRPTYQAAAGKWFPSGSGRRADLELINIGHDFSPTSSLVIRPGYENEGTEPTEVAERAEPTAPPQNVNEKTPSEHLVSMPRQDALTEISSVTTASHPPDAPPLVVRVPAPVPGETVLALSPLNIVNLDVRVSAILGIGAVLEAMIKFHTSPDGTLLRPLEDIRATVEALRKDLEILTNARKAGLT